MLNIQCENTGHIPSAVKAVGLFAALAARLKSCPDKDSEYPYRDSEVALARAFVFSNWLAVHSFSFGG